jgi:hypothetical protein
MALRGDSIAALTWAEKYGVKSGLSSAAGIVYAFQNVQLQVKLQERYHLSEEDNWRTDGFSRGKTLGDLHQSKPTRGWRNVPRVNLCSHEVLVLCGLDTFLDSDKEFEVFMARVQRVVRQ